MAPTEPGTSLGCPYCGATGAKEKTGRKRNEDKTRFVTIHSYLCVACNEWFSTEERLKAPLANVKINARPFDHSKLRPSISRFAPKRLTNSEADEVAKQAMYEIDAFVQSDKGHRRDQQGYFNISSDAVADRTLAAFLEVARRHRETGTRRDALHAAHVQYALATKGSGWVTASDFLRWYKTQEYASSTPRLDLAEREWKRNKVTWWAPPSSPFAKVEDVIKNTFLSSGGDDTGRDKETRHRQHEVFDHAKLTKSIELALRGRPTLARAEMVERYVLWALAGQTIVRSSQLSTLVSEILRSLDDIAYLRWVVIGKELTAITVYEEALGLVQHPSPTLEFRIDDSRVLRSAHVGRAAAGDVLEEVQS